MKKTSIFALALALVAAADGSRAEDRAVPFWPDAVPAAIHAQIDGPAALETVLLAGRYPPVPVSEISEYFELLARAKAVSFK